MDGNGEKFNSVNDLYKRVLPALNAKASELSRENIKFVTSKDIWAYCVTNCWKNRKDLRMYELVGDILDCDTLKLVNYVKINITDYKNKIDKDDN